MTKEEALKHLKAVTEAYGPDEGVAFFQSSWSAIHAAIKEVLAQPQHVDANDTSQERVDENAKQRQEPVVRWMCKGCGHEYMEAPNSCDCMDSTEYERIEYFTAPQNNPQRKPLSDEQIWQSDAIMSANSGYGATFDTLRELIRAIEAAHGIKE